MKKNLLLLKLFLCLMAFATQGAWATDHKIVVIADPHVMPASLLTDPSNADWSTYINGSRKLEDFSQALFDQAITEIAAMSPKPELVLIVGDLTKDGEKDSHDYVKGKLDVLESTYGIKSLVILGNHDRGTTNAKVYGDPTDDAVKYSESDLKTLYANYGFGTRDYGNGATVQEGSTLTYCCEPIAGLVIIGIDSGNDGELSSATLSWISTKASTAVAAGKKVIAMMHHPLIPHITGGDSFVNTAHVDDYENVRNTLADAGVGLIFTGHFHTSDIARDWNADKSKTIYDVNTGALCSYPCDYRVVTLNDDFSSVAVTTNSITTTTGTSLTGEAFSVSTAKTRLTSSMEDIVQPKLYDAAIAAGLRPLMANMASNALAPQLAEAYIYHADGDENVNADAQTLLSTLSGLLDDYPDYQATANSLLQDISNYGVDDRADQTNDRTLAFLADAGDNTAALSAINGKANATVVLSGRTINKDSYYKSLCLPFSLDATQLDESPLAGFTGLQELNVSTPYSGHTTGVEGTTLYLNFDDATTVTAGSPFIISWASGTAITDPVFTNVNPTSTSPTPVTFTGGQFVGTYSPFEINSANQNQVIYLGGSNTIGYASSTPKTLHSFRAHFEITGSGARMTGSVINFDDHTTGIINISGGLSNQSDDDFYGLDGRRISGQPTQKGVYIRNGKKVVIK